jgi:hypothetical protein
VIQKILDGLYAKAHQTGLLRAKKAKMVFEIMA